MFKRKITSLVSLVLICGMLFTTGCGDNNSDTSTDTDADVSTNSNDIDTSSQEESEPEPEYPDPAEVDIVSVGDDLIHSYVYRQAGYRSEVDGEYDWEYAYENIADIIGSADLATINQETMMSSEHEPSTYPQFNSPQSLGDHLIDIGFDMFSIANNHMFDVYEKGLASTIEFLKTKEPEVVHAGAYMTSEELMMPTTLERDGITFGFVSATQYTNGLSLPEGSELDFILTGDYEKLKAKIQATKEDCDMVIVNIHWGNEYSYEPTDGQRQLAELMVEWGANIIIGHHPHVLQPIEYIEKEDGTHALIAYSLGNFISAQDQLPRMLGGMIHYTVTKDFETGVVDVVNPQLEPIITHIDYDWSNIQINVLSEYTNDKANSHRLGFSLNEVNNLLTSIISDEFLTDYNEEIA